MSFILNSTRILFRRNHYMKRKMACHTFDIKNPSIQLNKTETKITNLLKDYVYSENSKGDDSHLELRITGGWVRDKLLGKESNDLDIAINTKSGEEFADGLAQFLSQHSEKYGIKPRGIHKIEKNPEKSKHLETATTKLYGLDIDFVNLRSEEYTEESRIPVIKYGTPEEDAKRRDATLNALFYNIQKDEVEDFTGSGLQDLSDGILKTPLPPLKTFLDDPLRVLRLIRFASRFDFTIAEETLESMKIGSIKDALQHKISRERVGVEMEKTLGGPNPTYGLQLISDANLLGSIFNFGPFQETVLKLNNVGDVFVEVQKITLNSIEKVKSLDYSQSSIDTVISKILTDKDLKLLFWVAIVLRPWASVQVVSNPKKPDTKTSAVELIVKEGLKFPKVDAEIISKIVSTKPTYQSIVSKLPDFKRSEIGLLLRPFGENHELAFIFNLFDEFINGNTNALSQYEKFHELIVKEQLEDSFKVRPIVDGKTLAKELGRKPGPWMSKVIESIIVWQFDNPTLGKEDCIEFAKSIVS